MPTRPKDIGGSQELVKRLPPQIIMRIFNIMQFFFKIARVDVG